VELLTDSEVAALVKVSRRQIWNLLAKGNLPEPVRLGQSRSVRWRRSDIERWIANGCRIASADAEKAVR